MASPAQSPQPSAKTDEAVRPAVEEDRAPVSEKTAQPVIEKAVPLAEDDAGAGAGGRDRRAQTGRSTAGHDDVGVGKDVGLTLGDTHSRKVPLRPRHALATEPRQRDRGPRPWVWCLGRAGRLFHERRPMTARRPRPPHPRTGTPNRARHRPGASRLA